MQLKKKKNLHLLHIVSIILPGNIIFLKRLGKFLFFQSRISKLSYLKQPHRLLQGPNTVAELHRFKGEVCLRLHFILLSFPVHNFCLFFYFYFSTWKFIVDALLGVLLARCWPGSKHSSQDLAPSLKTRQAKPCLQAKLWLPGTQQSQEHRGSACCQVACINMRAHARLCHMLVPTAESRKRERDHVQLLSTPVTWTKWRCPIPTTGWQRGH